MHINRFKATAAAFGLAFSCAAPVAHAAANLVANPQFEGFNFAPWHLWQPVGTSYANLGAYPSIARESSQIGGPNNILQLECTTVCPGSNKLALSQTINSLVTGHKYELSFYVAQLNRDANDVMYDLRMEVDFGSQHIGTNLAFPSGLAGNIDNGVSGIPGYRRNLGNYPELGNLWSQFTHQVIDFTYTGASSSADLTFLNHWASPEDFSCAPCYSVLDYANISLTDLGAPPPPPPPVSEPSSLATLALGLGALGLYFRRRRSNTES